MKSALVLLCGLLWLPHGLAQGVAADALERERIARERSAAHATYAEQQRRCAGEFAVEACLAPARKARRSTLDGLARESALLDSQIRRRRAADSALRVERKLQAAAPAASADAASGRKPAPPRAARGSRKAVPEADDPGRATGIGQAVPKAADAASGDARIPAAARDAEAARRVRAARERGEQAREHEEEVRLRNERRARGRKPSPPLPQPNAASSAIVPAKPAAAASAPGANANPSVPGR